MSSEQNEYSYTSQFAGTLRAESDRIPFHVSTRLRMRTDGTASEVRNGKAGDVRISVIERLLSGCQGLAGVPKRGKHRIGYRTAHARRDDP